MALVYTLMAHAHAARMHARMHIHTHIRTPHAHTNDTMQIARHESRNAMQNTHRRECSYSMQESDQQERLTDRAADKRGKLSFFVSRTAATQAAPQVKPLDWCWHTASTAPADHVEDGMPHDLFARTCCYLRQRRRSDGEASAQRITVWEPHWGTCRGICTSSMGC